MENYSDLEDDELIRRLRRGEQEILEFLMEKYKPLVKQKARTLFLAGGDQEDLLQEGMVGLLKAVREYDPDREASLLTFASLCITRYMLTAIESSQRRKHQPLNSFVSFAELEAADEAVPSGTWDPEKIMLDQEQTRALLDAIHGVLSSYENRVLDAYLQGLDYLKIAEDLNRTPKSVDNALQRIRTKVQGLL